MSNPLKTLLLALTLCICVSPFVWSEQAMDDLFEISLGELSQLVITGATLHEESFRSVPASVTVYSKEEIRQLGVTRLSQLMNYVPGFQSQRNDQSSVSDSYSARGIRFDGSGREILILLDGQRLNSDWGGGSSLRTGMIDLYLADRVEFIRGPSSPLYGSNAFIGIVNITTKADNEADVGFGLNNAYHASFSLAHSFDNGQLELFAKKRADQGQDIRIYDSNISDNIDSTDPYELENIHFKARYGDTSFLLHQHTVSNDDFFIGGFTSNSENTLKGETLIASLEHVMALENKWKLAASLSLSKYRFDVATVVVPPPTQVVIDGEIEEREPKVKLVLTQDLKSGEKNAFGFEWREPKIVDSDANLSGFSSAYLPQAPLTSRTIMGAFVQHQNYIQDDLHYVLGLRLDDYSNFGSHISPRAGLIWDINTSDTLKFLYGESFRAPSRSETDITNSAALLGNPDLKPEIAKTAEVVWLHQPKAYSLAITGYYSKLSDVIIKLPGTPSDRINDGDEEVSGVELELENLWHDHLTSRVNASWIISDLKNINSDARFVTGASIAYKYQNFETSLLVNYHSSKEDFDSSVNGYRKVPSRTFVEMNLRWKLSRSMEWYSHVSNALEETYFSVADGNVDNTVGTPNRGIDILTGLRMSF